MAWRTLHIARPARLLLRHAQVVVAQDDGEAAFPAEDVAAIVLDTGQATLTAALLAALTEHGIVLIVTDPKHHPSGILLSFHQHHAQSGIAQDQIGMTLPLRKRLWQRLVMAKIENQAAHLRECGGRDADALSAMVRRVRPGDGDNIEAQAARAYWPCIFDGFRRHADDRPNGLLDYGYAVVRAALARAVVAAGLLPAFGIHHAGRLNPFNLVDDLIEPYRPLVDRRARRWTDTKAVDALDLDDRRHMAGVLSEDVEVGDERLTLLAAAEVTAASLVRSMNAGSARPLLMPVLPLARRA